MMADDPANAASANDKSRLKDADAIRESVFRYQVASHVDPTTEVYFLSIWPVLKGRGDNFDTSNDPKPVFMKRLADMKIRVRNASDGKFATSQNGVIEKKSGKRGVLFQIKNLAWLSATEVDVEGGFVEGRLHARGYIYKLVKEKGKWRVKSSTNTWMS